MTRRGRLAMSLGLCLALAVMFVPLSASGQTSGRRPEPRSVKTSSDAARRKLDKSLQQAYDRHAKGEVAVFASVVGSPRGALRQLRNGRATAGSKASLVVGSIPTQRLRKLASDSECSPRKRLRLGVAQMATNKRYGERLVWRWRMAVR
jgi:hypothetical protein